MILEVAPLHVKAGQESEFEAAFLRAQCIISSVPGFVSHDLQRCIERPGEYLLLVVWQTVEDHEVGFRQSAGYQEWKRLLHHFYDPFPVVSHYRRVRGASSGETPKRVHPRITIRSETGTDADAIGNVTAAAFRTPEISSQTEQFIVEALRAAKALAVSLVAEMDGEVIGHIAFSPVTISDGTQGWYGLGPVSVLPAYQRQGIGRALIREGLSRLRAMDARGCCLVGHPGYYRQFGFRNPSGLVVEGVPSEVFFARSFDGSHPQGTVTFHEGFRADGHAAG